MGARILVVEDHDLTSTGIRELLAGAGYAEPVFAGSARAALAALQSARPDLVWLDLILPDRPGIEVLRYTRTLADPPPVVVVSGESRPTAYASALEAGAMAAVAKTEPSDVLLQALAAALRGEPFVSPAVSALIGAPAAAADLLTDRERHVLELVARGLTSKEIARELGISPATVKKHREHVMAKLGTKTAVQAARKAHALGLVSL